MLCREYLFDYGYQVYMGTGEVPVVLQIYQMIVPLQSNVVGMKHDQMAIFAVVKLF